MRIEIETIPHKEQRYPTCGDWYLEDGVLHIKVSEEVGGWQQQFLIALHEFVEVTLCMHDGPTQNDVDAFDMQYEKDRDAGLHGPQDEPGDDSAAPYYKQHQIATGIERIMAAELGVDWNKYSATIESL